MIDTIAWAERKGESDAIARRRPSPPYTYPAELHAYYDAYWTASRWVACQGTTWYGAYDA